MARKRRHRRRGVPPKPVTLAPVLTVDQAKPENWGGPTPETKRQHRKSSFARMVDTGEVGPVMFQAAQEIEAVYLAMTRGLLARSASPEGAIRGLVAPPSDVLAWAHAKRFKPWADRLSARRKRGGPPALEIVIDVVIDQAWLRDIDAARHWRNGSAKQIVRAALLEYAVMAGWEQAVELTAIRLAQGRSENAAWVVS